MEKKEQQAFPSHFEYSAKWGGDAIQEQGLSKREYFAGLAMQGLLANSTINQGYSSCLDWARSAVEFADALIEQLSTPQP